MLLSSLSATAFLVNLLLATTFHASNEQTTGIHEDPTLLSYSNHTMYTNKRFCPCRPLCARGTGFINPICWGIPSLKYRYQLSNDDVGDIHTCLYSLFMQIKGQQGAIETLVGHINRKLYDPRAGFLVHLAGDNGVGKTMSAGLLSIAISLFPHKSHRNAGETLLIISGAEFASVSGDSTEERQAAAQQIQSRLVAHVCKFSKCVILFDEITQMHPSLLQQLNPLFSAIEHGESIAGVPMTGVFCFLTSDFGSNGKTLGMTSTEVRTLVWEVIQDAYTYTPALKKANIIPFLALSPADFQDAIRYRLRTLKCNHSKKNSLFGTTNINIVDFVFDEEALVDFLYCKILGGIPQRNGREIDRVFDDYIEGPLVMKLAEFEMCASEKPSTSARGSHESNVWEYLHLGNRSLDVSVAFRVVNSAEGDKLDRKLVIEVLLDQQKR